MNCRPGIGCTTMWYGLFALVFHGYIGPPLPPCNTRAMGANAPFMQELCRSRTVPSYCGMTIAMPTF